MSGVILTPYSLNLSCEVKYTATVDRTANALIVIYNIKKTTLYIEWL